MSSPLKLEHRDTLSGIGTGLDFVELVGRTIASHARVPLGEHNHRGAFEICYLKRGSQTFVVAHNSNKVVSSEIAAVIAELRASPETRRSVEEMAHIAGLSESQFRARFEAEIGTSPSDYATRVRIDQAKELLIAGRRVTDVAFELDFGSTQYFATVFKQFTGLNPSQYAL